jgi:hypothetical protein
MPKPGMSGITLKNEVAELLRKRAEANTQGLNDYLLQLMMGPSLQHHQDSPGTVLTPVTTSIPVPASTSFLGEASFAKEGSMAGPRGIEPLTYGLRVRRSNLAELRAPLDY